jgi:hypothetical protein
MMRQALALTLLLSTLGATAASRSDPLASLRFLVGNWTCSYHQGSAGVTYKATFGYDMAGNWLRERDEWAGGGSDEALFTYDPTQRAWSWSWSRTSGRRRSFVVLALTPRTSCIAASIQKRA